MIKPVGGLHQTYVAFLYKVTQGQAATQVTFGHFDDSVCVWQSFSAHVGFKVKLSQLVSERMLWRYILWPIGI